MPDQEQDFSQELLSRPEGKHPPSRARISIAKRRIQSILDRETVAHQQTLEQKIAEQGPRAMRVDPHLVGLALFDLLKLDRLRIHEHTATGAKSWFANPLTTEAAAQERLVELAPLYGHVSQGGFGNLIGDALEVIAFKSLDRLYQASPRYAYLGQFYLDEPKNEEGRYRKTKPPNALAGHKTKKEADFIQLGHDAGPLCIECKNHREWLYPSSQDIRDLIIRAAELNTIPVLIARRIHYTTRTNLLVPAGIIAHETFNQYYPEDQAKIAERVRHKRSLGFTDVLASEEPHPRTTKFFERFLPSLLPAMSAAWRANKDDLLSYAHGETNLAQLYTAIGSPAGGKWQDFDAEDAE